MSKERGLLFIFILLGLFLVTMLLVQNIKTTKITGFATEDSTVSNVTISKYLSITLSTNLNDGILFGSLNPDTENSNATHNYDGASDASSMFVNVSTDTNTVVDLCIKANTNLTSSGSDMIALGNETYANNVTATDIDSPSLVNETTLTIDYVKSGTGIPIGSQGYFRFWLDVPTGQASGDYNNTVSFKGVELDAACGA